MSFIITSLCLRDGACVEVCPCECIVPGQPKNEWPWYFIDADMCIDCGACVPECPFEAIFPEEEVPNAYQLADGQVVKPMAGDSYTAPGTIIDLTPDIQANHDFYKKGPGYGARA